MVCRERKDAIGADCGDGEVAFVVGRRPLQLANSFYALATARRSLQRRFSLSQQHIKTGGKNRPLVARAEKLLRRQQRIAVACEVPIGVAKRGVNHREALEVVRRVELVCDADAAV